jgi:hypothetical protein
VQLQLQVLQPRLTYFMQQIPPQLAYQQLPSNSNIVALGRAAQALQQLRTLQAQMLASQRMQAQLRPLLRLSQNYLQAQGPIQALQ